MITVIHHSADADGWFCREIARKFLPDAELIGWDFGDAPIVFPKEGTIYILDLPPDRPFGMQSLSQMSPFDLERIVWIDHHRSSMDAYDLPPAQSEYEAACADVSHLPVNLPPTLRQMAARKIIPGYRIDGVSAARLAWQWFSYGRSSGIPVPTIAEFEQGKPAPLAKNLCALPSKQDFIDRTVSEPLAVQLAGEYDIFDLRNPDVKLFQHGLRSQELTENIWGLLLVPESLEVDGKKDIGTITVEALLERGEAVQYAQQQQDASIAKHRSFDLQFEGLTFLALNTARCNSLTFAAGVLPHHDALMGFFFNGKVWKVSLYHAPGKEHHDLSKIAVKYGGGGHAGAAGMILETLPFLNVV